LTWVKERAHLLQEVQAKNAAWKKANATCKRFST